MRLFSIFCSPLHNLHIRQAGTLESLRIRERESKKERDNEF
jgi:hypothetical protein